MASAQANGTPLRGARRARAGDALGPGLAAGDRPRAVRRAGDQAGRDGGQSPTAIPGPGRRGARATLEPPTGPTFVDFPLDHVFSEGDADRTISSRCRIALYAAGRGRRCDRPRGRAAARRRAAGRDGGHRALLGARRGRAARARRGARRAGVPQRPGARLPAGRSRALLLARAVEGTEGADVALVIGVPMDFRLGFGGSFGEETQIVVIGLGAARDAAPARAGGRAVRRRGGDAGRAARRRRRGAAPDRAEWLADAARGRGREARRRAGRARRRPRAAAPDAALPRAARRCSTATRS